MALYEIINNIVQKNKEYASFEELDCCVTELRKEKNYYDLFMLIKNKQFDKNSPIQLFEDGWTVRKLNSCFGYCLFTMKEIFINQNLPPYDFDVTLMHELIHAHYGKPLSDNRGERYSIEKGILVEWLARQLRASHQILRASLKTFNLPIRVYDIPSFYAFEDIKSQGILPFGLNKIEQIVMMDGSEDLEKN